MTDRKLLSSEEINARLQNLSAWKFEANALQREFKFQDFQEAFAFMTRIAFLAEKLDHHPDWTNIYNRVNIRLNTHDAGGVTALDFKLASQISSLLGGA